MTLGEPTEARGSMIDSLRAKADLLHRRRDCTFEDEAAANLMRAAAARITAQEAAIERVRNEAPDYIKALVRDV